MTSRFTARMRLPRGFVIAVRWGIGLGLIGFLFVRLDAADVFAQVQDANLWLAVPAIIGLIAIHLVGAATWRAIVDRLSADPLSWGDTVRIYYVAQALGGLTPGNLGADVYRVVVHGPKGSALRSGLLPILIQRATSSAALAVLGLLAITALPQIGSAGIVISATAIALAIVSAVLLTAMRLVPRWRETASAAPDPPGRGALAAGTLIGLAGALLFHASAIGLGMMLVLSVAPASDPVPFLVCLAIARLSLLVPIAPSGIGVQEGALTLLFVQIGLPAETALAAALLNRIGLLATIGLGGALFAIGRAEGSPPRVRAAPQPGWPTAAGSRPRVR
jgi:uncharacterized membrane protein YbhN (UPF0104 family)